MDQELLTAFIAEFTGTMMLLLLGCGVVANVILPATKGHGSGWIVIAFGWAIAVFVGVYVSVKLGGGGHLNPAITIAFWLTGNFQSQLVLPYVLAQFIGAMMGSGINFIAYKKHFDLSEDGEISKAVFCTAPAVRNKAYNFFAECVGTFVLTLGAVCITAPQVEIGTLNALPVALLVLGIGLSLGGPTGYAINPARDLGPRIMYSVLPVRNKVCSDWGYAWIPVIAPILGAIIAMLLFDAISG